MKCEYIISKMIKLFTKLSLFGLTIFVIGTINSQAQIFPDGTTVKIKADNGEFMGRCNGCQDTGRKVPDTVVLREDKGVYSIFKVVNTSAGKIKLIADNGKSVGYCNDCVKGGSVSSFIGVGTGSNYDTFSLGTLSNGKYSLKAVNGRFVTRCNNCSPSFRLGRNVVTAHAPNSSEPYSQWTILVQTSSKTSRSNPQNSNSTRNIKPSRGVKDLSGNWIGYDAGGKKTAYVWQIRQSLGLIYMKSVGRNNDKQEFRGVLSGSLITPDRLDTKATVSPDNKRISWTNGTYWIRQSSTNSSSSTNIGSKSTMPSVKNITGNWAGYFKDGRKSAYVWKISQNGSTLSIKEIGTSQNLASSGRINGSQVYATGFKTQGTLSTDRKRIVWTDGVIWVKQ